MATSKAKKPVVEPRRARVDEVRAQQRAAERKRSAIFIGGAVLLAVIIIAAAAIPLYNRWQEENRAISEFGVPAADAGCGEVIDDVAAGVNDHIGPGTNFPDTTRVDYETAPPSSGQHFAVTAGFARHFYTPEDTPPVENLVHNLEHGASIVWYDETVDEESVQELEGIANRISVDTPKFIVAPWDSEDRGEFPEGSIAISHWTAAPAGSAAETPGTGRRQYCEQVSGAAINEFVETFPYTDAPEPNGG
jgi:hypothetical protein